MADATLEYLASEVDRLGKLNEHLIKRLDAVEDELSRSIQRRDSISIGTEGKGGNLKCYFDATASAEENDRLMVEARRMLVQAGGSPLPVVLTENKGVQ